MSLVRTALRLLVIEAIKGNTLAGARVFDSMMGQLTPDQFNSGDEAPTAIVLSDKDEGEALSAQNGGPPFGREMEVSIELAMTSRVRRMDEDDIVVYPNTDARLEAALDTFEFQVLRSLAYASGPIPELFRAKFRITKYDCHRQIFDETGTKIACRIVTLLCYGSDDVHRIYTTGQDTMPTGYNKLPEPLRSVAELMPANSSSKNICDVIAAGIDSLTLPPLESFNAQVAGSLEEQGGDEMLDVTMAINSARSIPETVHTGGPLVIDYQRGLIQRITLVGSVTSMSVIGWPIAGKPGRLILQVYNTGNHAINQWPPGTMWTNGGDQPVVSVGAGKKDIFTLVSGDGGVEFFANVVGQNYSI